jgi:limonene-1,2-epoxide hydrolase
VTSVERYLAALQHHDWDALAGSLRHDVQRVGPFGDTYHGRDAYLAFLRGLLPTLADYSMDVHRVVEAGEVVTVELTESMTWDGARVVTPEALVFDLDRDGRIARIRIYIQRSPGTE